MCKNYKRVHSISVGINSSCQLKIIRKDTTKIQFVERRESDLQVNYVRRKLKESGPIDYIDSLWWKKGLSKNYS